jgi:hypothetical protein
VAEIRSGQAPSIRRILAREVQHLDFVTVEGGASLDVLKELGQAAGIRSSLSHQQHAGHQLVSPIEVPGRLNSERANG